MSTTKRAVVTEAESDEEPGPGNAVVIVPLAERCTYSATGARGEEDDEDEEGPER